MVAWTVFATWAYDAPRRRGLPLLLADFLLAAAALASTPYVQSDAMLARHASTLPSFAIITAVLAWAVARGWVWGLGAALVMSLVDLSVHTSPNGTTWGNIFLLLLAAGVVGYSTSLIREASEARAEAERIAAVLSERARLARAVHDGVLQVLALVQRRGTELGGEAAVIGRLAGDQEAALRALVQGEVPARGPTTEPATRARTGPSGGGQGGPADRPQDADLVSALSALVSRSVTVSGPGGEVRLSVEVVHEVRSVVRACLDNVERHVGPDAPAWVLVELIGDTVVVTVRDEGPGIAPGRLEQARSEGRLGVSESIQGRMTAIGGEAALVTGPGQGTEWELSLAIATAGSGTHSR
jgi:signal transduction histidine kinase